MQGSSWMEPHNQPLVTNTWAGQPVCPRPFGPHHAPDHPFYLAVANLLASDRGPVDTSTHKIVVR